MKDDRIELLEKLKKQGSTHDCPECKAPTYCAMEDGKSASTCWCMSVTSGINRIANYEFEKCQCRLCISGDLN